jgi:hypothetical protein
MRDQADYVTPRVFTLESRQIVAALGPASAGSGGGSSCTPDGWMGNCPV